MKDRRYYYGLDLIRFLAAISVVLFHLGYLNHGIAEYPQIAPIAWQGWIGVQIFFVISGFVIANTADGSTPRQFLRSRAMRLYPAAWCCATITFLASNADWGSYVRSMLLIPKGPWVDDVYWTLAVEVSFYLMIFALLCLNAFRIISRAAFAVTIFSAACLIMSAFTGLGSIVERMNLLLANHGCFFAIGIWIWCQTHRPLKPFELAGLILALLTGLGQICMYGAKFAPTPDTVWLIQPVLTWLAGVAAIYYFSIIDVKPSSILRSLGLMTYPLYLVHNATGRALEAKLISLGFDKWAALAGSAFFVIVLSWVICTFAEPWIRRAVP